MIEIIGAELAKMKATYEAVRPMAQAMGVPLPPTDGMTPENQALAAMVGITSRRLERLTMVGKLPFDQPMLVSSDRGFKLSMTATRSGEPLPDDARAVHVVLDPTNALKLLDEAGATRILQ